MLFVLPLALPCCRFPQFTPASWAKVIPSASPDAIDLIAKLTAWDPAKRLSSDQALRHPYFAVSRAWCGQARGWLEHLQRTVCVWLQLL